MSLNSRHKLSSFTKTNVQNLEMNNTTGGGGPTSKVPSMTRETLGSKEHGDWLTCWRSHGRNSDS